MDRPSGDCPLTLGSRVVIGGTHSGSGKTTVATGVMAALARRGLAVAPAKVGPDYIDPGYHALATGRPGRNLDEWICSTDAVLPLAARAAEGADVLVVEGVMGLFDGSSAPSARPGGRTVGDTDSDPDQPSQPDASTASIARLLRAPVILVVDATGIGRSVAAVVGGYARALMDGYGVPLAGVVLNKVRSEDHEAILRSALDPGGTPVLGALQRDDRLSWRDRHLGLVPVVEQPAEVARTLDVLAALVASRLDLDSLLSVARSAPDLPTVAPRPATPSGRCRIAVAAGPAFSFEYRDNLERLEEAGAEIAPFDPLTDATLPEGSTGLVAGGGFPEAYAAKLSANEPLRVAVGRAFARGELAIWAECGGLAWLARSLDGHPMCGVVPADVSMGDRLALGYRRARARVSSPVCDAATVLTGHEFHYSVSSPPGRAFDLTGWRGSRSEGFATPVLLATYLHQHLGWDPSPAERFVSVASSLASHPPA